MSKQGLKSIAILEATKGVLALVVSLGVHQLVGKDIQQFVESLSLSLHLNPAGYLQNTLINAATSLNNKSLFIVGLVAFVYAIIRFIEAYGLWHGYRWTQWFALISGAIYIPFELYDIVINTSILSVVLLMINLVVVAYLYYVLKKPQETRAADIH